MIKEAIEVAVGQVPKTDTPKTEVKSVRHEFTSEERQTIGSDLARAHATKRGTENEFDQVKASFKARITESEARIDKLSTDLMNGFEVRNKECVVRFRPMDRKKDFILPEDWEAFGEDAHPTLTEDMTAGDFQAELLQADSQFAHLERVELFRAMNQDSGVIVVGSLGKFWYAANRILIGKQKLEERLDSEQPAAKKRFDAIKSASVRYWTWLNSTLGKDNAKGFMGEMEKAIESQRERVE